MVQMLPQTIFDVVISCVDDRETLYNCSLTCRSFVPATRQDLFRYISVRSRAKFDYIRTCGDTSSIAPHLDILYLSEDIERPWIHSFPFIFPRHLRCVHHLTLQNVQFHRYPLHPWAPHAFGGSFSSLTTLNIAHGRFYDFVEFQRLVGAMTKLSRLTVEKIGFLAPPLRSNSPYIPRCPPLNTLWFDSECEGGVTAVVNWLLLPPLQPVFARHGTSAPEAQRSASRSIGDLQLWKQDTCDLPAVQRILNTLGSALEYFELSLRGWTRGGALRVLLLLSPNH